MYRNDLKLKLKIAFRIAAASFCLYKRYSGKPSFALAKNAQKNIKHVKGCSLNKGPLFLENECHIPRAL